jgi:hypothetical protein
MTELAPPLAIFYAGWDGFRQSLVKVVTPLSPQQIALPTALHHRSIGLVVQHILANRVWWFHKWMGAGNPGLAPIADRGWGEEGHEDTVYHTNGMNSFTCRAYSANSA